MKFADVIRAILFHVMVPLTPQEIRSVVKNEYPDFFGTPAHLRSVGRGHCKDLDHALLAQIYTLVGSSKAFICDKTFKPMKVSLRNKDDKYLQERKKLGLRRGKYEYHEPKVNQYELMVNDILENADNYHQAYYQAEVFSGPSLYFHLRALETQTEDLSLIHLEYVYAALTAWGMHRMGKRGAKMQEFEAFYHSVIDLRDRIRQAREFSIPNMDNGKWACVEEIFKGINVMASGTKLVGNSKAMHHMMPNIIPPIDRQYTLLFLRGNKNIKSDFEYQWQLMKGIISNFFIPIACNDAFQQKVKMWMGRKDKFPWDTSTLKVIDNLVVGSQK